MGKFTKKQQQLIVVVVLLSVGWGYVYINYLLRPTLKKIDERTAHYEDLKNKIDVAERQARRLPQLQAEYAQLQLQLANMEKQLPTDKDIPGIIRTITREAMDENLSFSSLKPDDPKRDSSNYFDVLEFEVSMTGSLQNFVRFMSKLGQQDRIFQFEKMGITGGLSDSSLGNPILNFTFTIKAYSYVG